MESERNFGGNNEYDIDNLVKFLEATTDESWCENVVKTKDGKNCLFGHIFDFGGGRAMDIFESNMASTYMVFPVNDKNHPDYQQPTAKERCLAYISDLRDGKQKTTIDIDREIYAELSGLA